MNKSDEPTTEAFSNLKLNQRASFRWVSAPYVTLIPDPPSWGERIRRQLMRLTWRFWIWVRQ